MARGSHSCAAEIDLGTTTPRKKPGPENLGSGDDTRELHKTRVFHQIFNAADGPEKSGFRACLTEIRPKPPSINPQTRKKSHNQNPGFARKTQVTHSPIPGLSRVSPRSRVFPGCLCCVLNRNPESPQVEEGYHSSGLLRVVLFLLSPDFERQEKAAKDRKRSKKEHAREKAGGPWGGPWPAWGGP